MGGLWPAHCHHPAAMAVDEAALLLGQLTALQLVHAAALPEDHRLLGSGGAASNRATPRAAALQLGGQLWRQYDGLLPAAPIVHAVDILVPAAIGGGGQRAAKDPSSRCHGAAQPEGVAFDQMPLGRGAHPAAFMRTLQSLSRRR